LEAHASNGSAIYFGNQLDLDGLSRLSQDSAGNFLLTGLIDQNRPIGSTW
jgi:hypothetical protein